MSLAIGLIALQRRCARLLRASPGASDGLRRLGADFGELIEAYLPGCNFGLALDMQSPRLGFPVVSIDRAVLVALKETVGTAQRPASTLPCGVAQQLGFDGSVPVYILPMSTGSPGFMWVAPRVALGEVSEELELLGEFALFLGLFFEPEPEPEGGRLTATLDALPVSVVLFDAQNRLLTVNAAFGVCFPEFKITSELPLEEFLQNFARAFPFVAADADWVKRQLGNCLAWQHREVLTLSDGRRLQWESRRTTDDGLILQLNDITEAHRQMQALEDSNTALNRIIAARDELQKHLSTVMDATKVGTWELDIPSRTVFASPQWMALVGVHSEGMVKLPHAAFIEMLHPDDREALVAEDELRPGVESANFENEFRMRHAEGHWIWVLSRGHVSSRDSSGGARLVTGVDLDITEQKMIEQKLRQSEELLLRAMESSVSAIAIFGSDDRLVYRNAEAAKLLDLVPGTLYGKNPQGQNWWLETPEGEILPWSDGPCNKARVTGETVRNQQLHVRRADGSLRIMTCNSTPLSGPDGLRDTVLSFWDVTNQQAAMDAMTAALAQAEATNRAKSAFLNTISHEIRTPLNGIMGFAEVLGLQLEDPGQREMAELIHSSGLELLEILNTTLDLAKAEASKLELTIEPLDVIGLIMGLEKVYEPLAAKKGLTFRIEGDPEGVPSWFGDQMRLKQVLVNLLDNALKFTPGGSVSLAVAGPVPNGPPELSFTVSDTGIGMTPEQAARAFEPFEQADSGLARRFGGTGLGLTIVREFVRLMRGEVTLSSAEGQGTEVKITLPMPEVSAA